MRGAVEPFTKTSAPDYAIIAGARKGVCRRAAFAGRRYCRLIGQRADAGTRAYRWCPLCARRWRPKIMWPKPRQLGDPGKHSGPKFFVVVERKYVIRPPRSRQCAVRAALTLDRPAGANRRANTRPAFVAGRPFTLRKKDRSAQKGTGSPCPIRSAMTRSASAVVLSRTSASVVP